jgi:hypothetical protein
MCCRHETDTYGEQVNEKIRNAESLVDLSALSDKELNLVVEEAQKEMERRKEQRRYDALQRVLALADEVGMTPEEVLSMATAGKGKRRRRGKRGAIAWQHPDDPTKVYRGGKKPDWVRELKEQVREPVKVE